jgi:hypothetical protein
MKIHQLISGVHLPITNEEQEFINNHGDGVKLTALNDHEQWIAQNLVRKGAYGMGKSDNLLIRKSHEAND